MKKEETFTEVYRRHAASIIKSVVARTSDRELADEICQNVFLAYYRHMDRIDHEYVKAWLFQCVENQLTDYYRKCGINRERMAEEDIDGVLDPADGVDIAKQCSDRRFICEILERLRTKNRNWYEVIECICVRQMTQEETSVYLGISPTDLRSRLYRARKYLKEEFDEER